MINPGKWKSSDLFFFDALTLFSKEESTIDRLQWGLRANFFIKDLDIHRQFLGMEIDWSHSSEALLYHINLVQTLLHQNGVQEASLVAGPLNADVELSKKTDRLTNFEAHEYGSNVRSLSYLATNAPIGLCLSTTILCFHVSEPT